MTRDDAPALLNELSWTEARDILSLNPVGLLPVGAIEAHGPHLPLDTDVIIANGMARSASASLRRSGLPSLILPTVPYSVSFAGACFPGTSPVDATAFGPFLASLLEHSANQGYRLICVCNAHLEPQHFETMQRAVDEASASSHIPIIIPDKRSPDWSVHLGEEFQRGMRHAGRYETSIVLAERPERVRRTQLEELEPVWIDLPAALKAGARDFFEAGAKDGYFGDPSSATAEFGRELLDTLGILLRDRILEELARHPAAREGS